ncbi:MAG: rRNA maturation RNAse YbeY, partial [Planctomycetaceae bacterium]|nr:rRNA maturation RNAse YbeY [Planctomycetaceae bacterium]
EEVVLYLIHGILHLVGYDDLTSTEQAVMRTRERAMLAEFHITPPPNPPFPPSEPSSLSQQSEAPPDEPPLSRRAES